MRRIAAARFSTQPSPLTKMLIPASKHYISNISNHSFTVSGQGGYQQVVNGPLAIVSNRILLWDAPQYGVGGSSNLNVDPANVNEIDLSPTPSNPAKQTGEDTSVFYGWTSANLEIFKTPPNTENKPDILVLGTGGNSCRLPDDLRSFCRENGMQVEVSTSQNAASTYNVLLAEGRRVACAILPIIPTCARTGKCLVELHH